MSDPLSTDNGSPAEKKRAERQSLSFRLALWGILLLLVLAASVLRLYRIGELPPGLYMDEGAHGVDALNVLDGEHAVFFVENYGREGLVVYTTALATALLGRSALAPRLPIAIASAGTVLVLFWLGRILFGRDEETGLPTPWRGLLVGGASAGLLAVSLGQTIVGRNAFRANLLAFFICLCLALLWRGWRQNSRWQVAMAGLCTGLLSYTYITARFAPFLFLLFGLSFLPPVGRAVRAAKDSTKTTRLALFSNLAPEDWSKAAVFAGTAALVSAPLLLHFAQNPDHFFIRSSKTLIFTPALSHGDPLGSYLRNVWEHLLAFGFRSDHNWRQALPTQPILNVWEASLFWLGAATALWRWKRRPAYRLMLIWVAVLSFPATLAVGPGPAPSTLRMTGAFPAAFLLIGVGLWELFLFLKARLFRGREAAFAILFSLLVCCLIAVRGVNTYYSYFVEWAAAPKLHRYYETNWRDLAQTLNELPSSADSVYLIALQSLYNWSLLTDTHYSFAYLYQGEAPARTISATVPYNLAPGIRSTLSEFDQLATVHYVDWNDELVGGNLQADPQALLLLGKYGRSLESADFGNFRIHSYKSIRLDVPWKTYDRMEQLAVHYDRGISLLGLSLIADEGEPPAAHVRDLGRDRTPWIVLQWQVAPGLESDYSVSLRLLDDDDKLVFQYDQVLWDENSRSTSHWTPDKSVDTPFFLSFPADIPAGEYEMRLVVYDFATSQPTVELGVWEPETVLARLKLAAQSE